MIILKEIVQSAAGKIYHFCRLRSDGLELDALNISLDGQGAIVSIEILHNIEGDCAFSDSGELVHCTAWESEAEAQQASDWSRHYPLRVGIAKAGRAEALRIFHNLRSVIYDNYLKHLLGIFPSGKTRLIFDESLYTVYIPELAQPQPAADVPESESDVRSFFNRHRRVLRICGISMLVLCGGLVAFLLRKPKFPPRTEEMARMGKTELLPALKFLDRDFSEILQQYGREHGPGLPAYGEKAADVEFKSPDQFLDDLYPLDKEIQIRIFHDQVFKNVKFFSREKAGIFRRLFDENLIRTISMTPDGIIPFAFDYLKNQLDKNSLLNYTLYLITHEQNSALAIEAMLIFFRITEIQKHTVSFIFYEREIRETCINRDFERLKHPNEAIILCETLEKHNAWKMMDKEILMGKFHTMQESILKHLSASAGQSTRLADIKFELALVRFEAAQTPADMASAIALFYEIPVPAEPGGFAYRESHQQLLKLFAQKQPELRSLRNRKKEEGDLSKLTAKADALRSSLNRSAKIPATLKDQVSQTMRKWHANVAERNIKRARKFAEKTVNK